MTKRLRNDDGGVVDGVVVDASAKSGIACRRGAGRLDDRRQSGGGSDRR